MNMLYTRKRFPFCLVFTFEKVIHNVEVKVDVQEGP